MLEQVKSVRSPSSEEEGAAEKTCDELTVAPISHSPESDEVEKIGSEVELEKKGEVRGGCFKIRVYFLLPYSDLIGNKIFFSPGQVSFVHDGNGWVIFPSPYLDP